MFSFFPSLSLLSPCVVLVPVDSGKFGVGLGSLWKEVVVWGGNPQWVPCGF